MRPLLAFGLLLRRRRGRRHAAFPASPPNDPLFDASPLPNATNEQWDLASPALGFDRGISAERAWPLTTGAGVVIADIDVGVQLDHPDLAGRWAARLRLLRPRRATRRSDTAQRPRHERRRRARRGGRQRHRDRRASRPAPRSCRCARRTTSSTSRRGSRRGSSTRPTAGRGVMSMSLGADSYSPGLYGGPWPTRTGAARCSWPRRATSSASTTTSRPRFDEAIAVGGLNPDTANAAALQRATLALSGTDFTVRAAYSDYGPHIDVVAPDAGADHRATAAATRLNWRGTSAATPHVAGVAALVLARGQALGPRAHARRGAARSCGRPPTTSPTRPRATRPGLGPPHRLRAGERRARGRARGAGPDPARRRHHRAPAGTRRLAARRSRCAGARRRAGRSSSAAGRSRRPGGGSPRGRGSGRRVRRLAAHRSARPRRRAARRCACVRTDASGNGRGPRVLLRAARPARSSAASRGTSAAPARRRPRWRT